MNGIRTEIKDRQGIEALGFPYAEDESRCRGHMFNAIPVAIDIRDHPEYDLAEVEEDMNRVFRAVLQWELRDSGVKALREISWDRVFFMKHWWEPREFEVLFWVRVVSEDYVKDTDSHVTRV